MRFFAAVGLTNDIQLRTRISLMKMIAVLRNHSEKPELSKVYDSGNECIKVDSGAPGSMLHAEMRRVHFKS
jgi:hypothetical protein